MHSVHVCCRYVLYTQVIRQLSEIALWLSLIHICKTFKDYRVNAEGKLTLDDKQVETTLRVKPLEKPESDSELWIVTLPERCV